MILKRCCDSERLLRSMGVRTANPKRTAWLYYAHSDWSPAIPTEKFRDVVAQHRGDTLFR